MTGPRFSGRVNERLGVGAHAQLDLHLGHTLAGAAFSDDRQVLAQNIASEIANCDLGYAPFLANWLCDSLRNLLIACINRRATRG